LVLGEWNLFPSWVTNILIRYLRSTFCDSTVTIVAKMRIS
jgi:hypothetical protein